MKLALVIGKHEQVIHHHGSSADEAWVPASKDRVQTARHSHAGRGEVGRGRWCG